MATKKQLFREAINKSLGGIADLPEEIQVLLLDDIAQAIEKRIKTIEQCIAIAEGVKDQ
jgi:hypothetical protein